MYYTRTAGAYVSVPALAHVMVGFGMVEVLASGVYSFSMETPSARDATYKTNCHMLVRC